VPRPRPTFPVAWPQIPLFLNLNRAWYPEFYRRLLAGNVSTRNVQNKFYVTVTIPRKFCAPVAHSIVRIIE
jgi:hypothetical protein